MSERFIDSYLLYQMTLLSHKFSASFHEYLRTKGVTPSRWRILLNLSDMPGMYVKQLAEHTCFEQSRLTKSIAKMSAEGLVKKLVDSTDKRRVFICITEKGEQCVAPLIKAAKRNEDKVLEQLPENDRETLKSILAAFMKNQSKNEENLT